MPRRTVRTTRALGVLVSMTLALLPAAPAAARPRPSGPSAQDVARAQQEARSRLAAASTAQARLAQADAQLSRLNAAAELKVEAYDGAMVHLAAARQAAEQAREAQAAAQERVAEQRRAMGALAAAGYRSGGNLAMLGLVLQSGGPSAFLQRAGYLQHIAEQQTAGYARLRAALADQQVAADTSRARLADVTTAADAAQAARSAAAAAVAQQQQQVQAFSARRAQLALEAGRAQQRAGRLVAARAAFLEAQRAEAARAAAARAAAQAAARAAREAAARRRQQEAAARRRQQEAAAEAAPGDAGPDQGGSAAGSGGDSTGAGSGAQDAGGVDTGSVAATGGASTASQGERVVAYARAQLGKPYQWAASGPDTFDCSGLTMMAWRSVGVSLAHFAATQYAQGARVDRSQLRPGDLVFFATDLSDASSIHHVGIYAGDGLMISAPKTGDVVKYQPAFRSDYFGASRP